MRRYWITAAVAIAAAGLTVGLTLATRNTVPKPPAAQAGRPPLVLDLGVRTDPEAVALRRAADLYDKGRVGEARPVFARYTSPEAEVGAALADWPAGFERLYALARAKPRNALVQLNYGVGLYWRGDTAGAKRAWRAARRSEPDTPYAIRAGDLLYPNFPRGLPTFVPSFLPPQALAKRYPNSQSVRFHLGLCLLWLGSVDQAKKELRLARDAGPDTPLGTEARRFLERLANVGTR
jgi:tetratricopeptide (TPR) repeat protein